jgi:thiol-disulfide isomerase/thioredoxin
VTRAVAGTLSLLVAFAACNPSTKSESANDAVRSGRAEGRSPSNESDGTAASSAGRHLVVEAAQDTDALSLIRTKRLEAKAEGRVLVVYVGATWCEPCKRFKAEMSSGRLDERYGKVTLLAFDADKDGDRLGAAGYSYRFVPFVALPGVDGHPSDTQQATGKGGEAWRELLGKLDTWQGGVAAH